MMGRRNGQTAMVFVDMESMIPENHLLRKIDRVISFEFIYDLLAPYYPSIGRPSVDPVCMFKMLLVGYLYGIKSERRLEEEVQLNLAYRWFCGFELDEAHLQQNQNSQMAGKQSFPKSFSRNYKAVYYKWPDRRESDGYRWKLYPGQCVPRKLGRCRSRS